MALKLKFRAMFPALVQADSPITLTKVGGSYTFGFNQTALGYGTAAFANLGTSGNKVPLLDGVNTWSASQTVQGLTTTSPGWYAQITADTNARVSVGVNATDGASLAFGPGNAVRDTFIERFGAASIRFGAADAATAVAQIAGVQNVVAGTSNTAGAAWTFNASRGTGSGVGGSFIFKTAPAGGSGTAQNALSNALTIFGTGGLATGAATDQGAGTLNLAGSLYSNGTAPTGTGGYVRATAPTIAGFTDASNAAPGVVGEMISATTLFGSAVSLTSTTPANIATITLTAGDWDISAMAYFTGGASTTVTSLRSSISTASATENAVVPLYLAAGFSGATLFSVVDWGWAISGTRISLSGSQQYWLVSRAVFGTSTCIGYGAIRARRVR